VNAATISSQARRHRLTWLRVPGRRYQIGFRPSAALGRGNPAGAIRIDDGIRTPCVQYEPVAIPHFSPELPTANAIDPDRPATLFLTLRGMQPESWNVHIPCLLRGNQGSQQHARPLRMRKALCISRPRPVLSAMALIPRALATLCAVHRSPPLQRRVTWSQGAAAHESPSPAGKPGTVQSIEGALARRRLADRLREAPRTAQSCLAQADPDGLQ
jgi:hypothetical protein